MLVNSTTRTNLIHFQSDAALAETAEKHRCGKQSKFLNATAKRPMLALL